MGAVGGRTANSVAEKLFVEGHEFEFFQAVRLLYRILHDRRPVGEAAKPSDEAVHFSSRVSLEFPASSIHELEAGEAPEDPAKMTVAFMGLMGTQGVLPFHYTEWMLARQGAKDTAMAGFFDIFNHRWLSLFYRVWEKHRLPVAYERGSLEAKSKERLGRYLFDLIGMGTSGLADRLSIPTEGLLRYAGLITQRPHSASALRGILRDYFGVDVDIQQFRGSWWFLSKADRCYLDKGGLHNQLGDGAILGDAIWDQQSRFQIRIGPLTMNQFRSFLPDGRATEALSTLTRFYAGIALSFEVRLVLQAADVPSCQLQDEAESAPRLGWNTWLKAEQFTHDADDAVFAMAS